jgi:uncharacterized protein (UPF0303 family)
MDVHGKLMDEIAAQEKELQFERFSNEDALRLGLILVEKATARGLAVAIDISRGGQQLFHYAFAGTSVDNDGWIARKNRVVARFGHASLWIGAKLRREGLALEEKFFISPLEYSPHGGAFPIILRGTGPVGIATVSGLKQEDDHALVVEALRELLDSNA